MFTIHFDTPTHSKFFIYSRWVHFWRLVQLLYNEKREDLSKGIIKRVIYIANLFSKNFSFSLNVYLHQAKSDGKIIFNLRSSQIVLYTIIFTGSWSFFVQTKSTSLTFPKPTSVNLNVLWDNIYDRNKQSFQESKW